MQVLLIMGIVLRQFAKDCVDKMPVPDFGFFVKNILSQLDQLYKV